MLKIGIITIGQAGGNVAESFVSLGFDVLAMNSSNEDLKKFTEGEICSFYKMGGEHITGCAMERSLAIDIVKSNYEDIVKSIQKEFEGIEIDIFNIVASSSGGTGSGSTPLICKILRQAFPGVEVIATLIVPDRGGSNKALSNAVECLQELEKLKVPVMAYDNEKVRELEPTQKAMYQNINASIANDLLYISGQKREPSEIGNIDDRDMLKIATTPGITTITHVNVKENMLDKKDMNTFIQEAFNKNKFIMFEGDKIVKRIGVIINLPKSISSELDMSLSVVKDEIGEPLEIFYHIHDEEQVREGQGTITIICSGLSYPINRIGELSKKVNNRREAATVERSENLEEARISIGWLTDDDAVRLGKHKASKVIANMEKIDLDI